MEAIIEALFDTELGLVILGILIMVGIGIEIFKGDKNERED